MSAYVHLTDVAVLPGYEDRPQTKFNEKQNNFGILRFKVTNVYRTRNDSGEWENAYNKYNVEYRCRKDSKQISFLNGKGVRVCVRGELSEEEYKEKKFLRVRADDVKLTKFPNKEESSQNSSQNSSSNDDDIPF